MMKNLPFIQKFSLYFSALLPQNPPKMARNFKFIFLIAFCLTTVAGFAQAPTVSYASPQSYTVGATITPLVPTSSGVAAPAYSAPIVTGSGLSQPFGIAIDVSSNIYIADAGNNAIKKIPAGGGTPVSLGSGFSNPQGIAFRAGNLYIADAGNNAIKKMPIAGGTPTTLGSGFLSPSAVAVDASSNVYVADNGHNAVKEILAGSGTIITLGVGFNLVTGLTVDAFGNVYVADKGNNVVKRIPPGGGTQVTVGSGFNAPAGVTVDASGNVYVTDSGNTAIKKIAVSGGAPVTIGSGFATGFVPYGIIVDNVGNVYVTDHANNAVNELLPTGGYYLHPALPRGLTMSNSTGTISGKPLLIQAAATYTVVAHNSTGSVTTTLSIAISPSPKPNISYTSPQSYALHTAITPLSPTNTGGAVPAPAVTTLASGFSGPTGVAVDASGNVYVADDANNAVKEIPAGTTTAVTIGSGFSGPTGVAVDASGNVYVADYGNNAVKEILTGGTILTLGSGFSHPYGVAVDAAGNIYVGDSGNNTVKKMPAGGGTPTAIGTGISSPQGVAVDASGNVYVADFGNGYIKEIMAVGGGTVTLSPNLGAPYGVAVDAAGQVYYADANGTTAVFILPKGGGSPIALGSGLNSAAGLATDQYGFVYVDDTGNNLVKKISVGGYYVYPNLPAGLTLTKATGVISGTPTAATPATNYNVVAFNSSGRDTTVINITVPAVSKPVISYATPQVFTTGTTISTLTPTNTGGAVSAQTSTVLGPNFEEPVGVAVDAAGNIFVSQDNTSYGIDKIPSGGGSTVRVGGSNYGYGIAVDASDNLYLGSASNLAQVLKIPAGSSTGTAVGSGFSLPRAVAVDAAGNVYVADRNLTTIQKIPAGGGAQVSLGSGFNAPVGVAVDAAGNVYVADNGNNALKEIPAGGGSPVTLATDVNGVISVAVGTDGLVYFGDASGITKVPLGGGNVIRVPYYFYYPYGIAVDQFNNLFAANSNTSSATVVKITAGGYAVSPALPAGLTFNASTGAISGTPFATSPATNYTVTAFNSGGYGTFVINITVNAPPAPVISYTTPNVYTVGTAISPLSPTNTGGAVAPINPIPVLSQSGSALAMDAAGNYYLPQTTYSTNHIYQTIFKVPVDGSANVAIATITYFGETIKGITVDASGNVFFTTFKEGIVYEAPVGGGALINLGAIAAPYGVAVDPSGNIYAASTTANAVYKIPPGGGTPVSIGSGFSNPTSLATDASGNLFITDRGHNAIKEIPAGGGGPLTLATGVSNDITVDGSGNVYFVNSAGSVSRISAIGGTAVYASGFNNIYGLSANSNGDLFVLDYGFGKISEIAPGGYFVNPALPAGLSLDINTGVISGTPTAVHASTFYTVSGYNTGGHSTATVGITVNGISSNANLAHMVISKGVLAPAFSSATTTYTTTVSNTITSITLTPTTSESHATVTVNGTAVTSGTASGALPLSVGPNTITTVVTAQDGTTTKTYTLTVTRAASNNAKLAHLVISRGVLSPTFNSATTSYTAGVGNPITSITVTPTTAFAGATVTVNGTAVTSGTASAPITLATGPNTITTIVTAQDGTTTMTYTVTITRAGGGGINTIYDAVSVERPLSEPQIQNDGIIVHQGMSPNGDGINDFLMIDGIASYPENKLQVMNRSGQLIFEAKNYDNSTKVFDGHSNKTGAMQLPGTYFYSLDYVVNGVAKHKTGFVVLKY